MKQTSSSNTDQMPVRSPDSSDHSAHPDQDGRLSLAAAMRLVPNKLTAVRFAAVPVM